MTDPESLPPAAEGGPPPDKPAAEERPERYPFWGWTDVLIAFAGMAGILVISVLALALGIAVAGKSAKVLAILSVLTIFVMYGLFFPFLAALLRIRYNRPFWRSLAWVRPRPTKLRPWAWGILTAIGAIVLSLVMRTPNTETQLQALMRDPSVAVLVAILAITLGPISEELIFRGFLFPVIARTFGPAAGIVLTAVPFALLHGFQYLWIWQYMAVLIFAGSAFGLMRYASGSTLASTMMHAAYNATFIAGLVAERFQSGRVA